MKKVGLIGMRGMVGSVLLNRMRQENDFQLFDSFFFSTSQQNMQAPTVSNGFDKYLNASDIEQLKNMDLIVTCQGGEYTKEIYPKLRSSGWKGFWIDASSALRMEKNSVIILDPVNLDVIQKGLKSGVRDFIGGNCTVSLMLMGLGNLFKANLVEWMTTMTYQAASGAGARNMYELIRQMRYLGEIAPSESLIGDILEFDQKLSQKLRSDAAPKSQFGAMLAGNLLPWIDSELPNGQSKEEWKGIAETNKILGLENNVIPVDGTCVRIGAMRSHSQAITLKLKKNVPIQDVEDLIRSTNEWVELIPNTKKDSIERLTPAYTSGTLKVVVGRVRKMNLGDEYLNIFTVGDQLLWGAAEPLRRMLRIILQ